MRREFVPEGFQHRSTVPKDDRRHSIGSISLPSIKARKGIENILLENLKFKDSYDGGG